MDLNLSYLGRITSTSFCILLRFRVLLPTADALAVDVFLWGCCLGGSGRGGGDGLSLAEATMATPCLASPRRPRLKYEKSAYC